MSFFVDFEMVPFADVTSSKCLRGVRDVETGLIADNLTCPCLWVGTSLGSVIVINLNLPGLGSDQRSQQPVIVSPSG